MASFRYKAKTPKGEIVTGNFDAVDSSMVVSLLKSKGFYPISIDENVGADREMKLGSLKRVTAKDLAIFCRQFHTMLNAGVSILGCLDLLRKQTENPRLVEVTNRIFDDVQKGHTLSESMKACQEVFPVIFISMVEVGEVSGTLDEVLERLAVQFEKDNKIKQKIKTAMTYPAMIGCIALVMVIFMLAFVVPNFVKMFNTFGSKLPAPTRVLLAVSHTVTNVWFILCFIAAVAALVYLFRRFKNSQKGRHMIDSILINMPMVGKNVKKILASRFTRTLSSLLYSGVPLIQALDVAEKVVDNRLVSQGMVKVKEDITRGSNLAGPLEGMGIFPQMVTQMISIGEEAGSLDSIMGKVADFYDEELDTSISQLISMLEPLMIFFLAVIVGSIVIAMILPVFSMYSNIK